MAPAAAPALSSRIRTVAGGNDGVPGGGRPAGPATVQQIDWIPLFESSIPQFCRLQKSDYLSSIKNSKILSLLLLIHENL